MKIKLILLCVVISVASCTKDDAVQVENSTKLSIVDQISALSGDYNTGLIKADINYYKVAAADVGAALTEASSDNSSGASIISAGAAASTKNYNDQTSANSSSSNTSHGDDTGVAQVAPNKENPYDYYGYWHYASIDNVLVNPRRYLEGEDYDNERFYESTRGYLLDNNIATHSDFENFSLEIANEKLAFNSKIFDHYGLSGGLTYLLENGKIKESVYEIMMPYYTVLENINSPDQFVDYSLQAEKLVVYSELEGKEKEIILSTMATARYGIQYWSNVFRN